MECKVCGKNYGFKNDYPNIKGDYSYITCMNCGSGILDPFPKTKVFQEKYDTEEYYDDLSAKAKNKFLDFFLNMRIYEMPWEFVSNFEIKKNNALDVGCGNGEFLYEVKKFGFNVYATDYSKIALERTRKKVNEKKENFYLGDFSNIDFNERFNLISFWHVLEHVESPSKYLEKAFSILEKDGVVVGEVPNYNSLILSIFKDKYSWIMIPEHITYYSPKSLEMVLRNQGFTDIMVFNPNRAVINLTASLMNIIKSFSLTPNLEKCIYFSSLLITIPIMIIISIFNKGEVLRFYAKK